MLPRRIAFLLAAAVALAACGGSEPPRVTFDAGGASVEAGPAQYCDLRMTDCTGDPKAPVQLAVPTGTPLRVTVPPEIAETPWQVAYSYRDAAGQQVDERTSVFAPNVRGDVTIALPEGARLLTAQVQQYGAPPTADESTMEIEFPIRASWVLTATS